MIEVLNLGSLNTRLGVYYSFVLVMNSVKHTFGSPVTSLGDEITTLRPSFLGM